MKQLTKALCIPLSLLIALSLLSSCGGGSAPASSAPAAGSMDASAPVAGSTVSPAPSSAPLPSVDTPDVAVSSTASEDSGQDIPPSDYTGSFELAGMWADEAGTILTFNANGSVGPMLFGFEGGPDGSWAISSGTNTAGHYTLQTSHITGGSPQYIVRLISADEIELYAESGVNFGREYYHLTRQ